MGWLEAEYESFITTHLDFHDTSEDALVLVAEYEEFLEKLGPTCRKVERVIDLLTQLSPKAPLLSSAIHHLCQVVSSRIKKIKEIVFQCSSILQMFVKFCNLFKDVSFDMYWKLGYSSLQRDFCPFVDIVGIVGIVGLVGITGKTRFDLSLCFAWSHPI